MTLLFSLPVGAKKYPFKIDTSREVVISRSSKAGTKMVEVTAYGRTADKAIEQAMMDAVVSLSFGVYPVPEKWKMPCHPF